MHLEKTALEFFSGIGAFCQVCPEFGINLIESFDQGQDANKVYESNYRRKPSARNLDSIRADEIPPVRIWWLSPPCLPYTRKGNAKDLDDSRAASLLNLINQIPHLLPERIFLENVLEFKDSKVLQIFLNQLHQCHYQYRSFQICSSQLGTPMKRRRFYLAARRGGNIKEELQLQNHFNSRKLSDFLCPETEVDQSLFLKPQLLASHLETFDIVNDECGLTTCFTSSYGRQHRASGSLLKMSDGAIRYFSAEEIIALLGFSSTFKFGDELSNKTKWRLAGNSVDTRIIRLLLKASGL